MSNHKFDLDQTVWFDRGYTKRGKLEIVQAKIIGYDVLKGKDTRYIVEFEKPYQDSYVLREVEEWRLANTKEELKVSIMNMFDQL